MVEGEKLTDEREDSPQKFKFTHYLLTSMPTEGWCLGPEQTFGVSRVNNVEVKSNTIEVNGDHFFQRTKNSRKNRIKCLHTAPVVSSKCQ